MTDADAHAGSSGASARARRTPDAGPLGSARALRFLVVFALGFVAFQAVFAWLVVPSRMLRRWMAWNGALASSVLDTFGAPVSARGTWLQFENTAVRIGVGCDGLQPVALFSIAVLAFPASRRRKVAALAVGVPALLALNVTRIGSLLVVQRFLPEWFDWLHRVGWPMVFVALPMIAWWSWAHRATVAVGR